MIRMTEKRRTRSVQRGIEIAVLILFGRQGAAWAAAETFSTALPVAAGDFVYRQQFLFLRSTGDPTPASGEADAFGGVSYQVSDGLTQSCFARRGADLIEGSERDEVRDDDTAAG